MSIVVSWNRQTLHIHCQRAILDVNWQDMIRNGAITELTGRCEINDIIQTRRAAAITLWGLVNGLQLMCNWFPLGICTCSSLPILKASPLQDAWHLKPQTSAALGWPTSIQTHWDNALQRGHGTKARPISYCEWKKEWNNTNSNAILLSLFNYRTLFIFFFNNYIVIV